MADVLDVARVQDLRKIGVEWDSWEPAVHEFDNGHRIIDLMTYKDLRQLGKIQNHCSGRHIRWVVDVPISKFLVLCDATGTPSVAAHVKRKAWMNKSHPRDTEMRQLGVPREFDPDGHGCVTSYAYDYQAQGGYDYNAPQDAAYWEREFVYAKERYEEEKRNAIRWHGALGPNNPYKYYVDEANRYIQTCSKAIAEAQKKAPEALLNVGDMFSYKRMIWVVLGFSGRGTDDPARVRKQFRAWVDSHDGFRGHYEKG